MTARPAPLRVVRLTKTAEACPSAWEGRTDTGEWVYVRYRWGSLTVGAGATRDEAVARGIWEGQGGRTVFAGELGDRLDSWLSFEELVRATAGTIAWDCERPEELTGEEVREIFAKAMDFVHELAAQGKITLIKLPAQELASMVKRFEPRDRPGLDVRCPRCASLQPVSEVPVPAGRRFRCSCGEVFVYEG